MDIKDGRKLSPSAQEAIRRKAVYAVITGVMTQTRAAEIFGVSRTSVCLWVNAYRLKGEEALRGGSKGRPAGGVLTAVQLASIRQSVLEKSPDQSGLPGLLWTRELVGDLIRRRFDVCLSRWTVGRLFRQWGLTPQKPAKRALKQNPAQVSYWLEHNYPAIKSQAAAEGGKIWWVDETGLRSTQQKTGTTCGEKGVAPLARMSGKRFVCTVLTAITNHGSLSFMVYDSRFTVPLFLDFLERLVKQQAEQKVFLIVDRHSVHKAAKIEEWLAPRKKQIEMFFLPVCSPELNPDELANQNIK